MWLIFCCASLSLLVQLDAKGNVGTQSPPQEEYVYCYDCHYDPDAEKEAYGSPQAGRYPGYPKCALDGSVDESSVDKWPCRTGKCFIRRDPNGLVYRGCADPWNLPWGVDDSKSCEYQGQKPSLWWFCDGERCNGGSFSSGDICPDPPAVPYDINDDAYVETVHGSQEGYPGDSDSYNGKSYGQESYGKKSYKAEPANYEPPTQQEKSKSYNNNKGDKYESGKKSYQAPQPEENYGKKSGYGGSNGKEGREGVDIYGVYTAEVAPVHPKKSVRPVQVPAYDRWMMPYDPQSYNKNGNRNQDYESGKKSYQKKPVYEQPEPKKNSNYKSEQPTKSVQPKPNYKSEPPKQHSKSQKEPTKSVPHYKSVKSFEPPSKSVKSYQPPQKSTQPPSKSYEQPPSKSYQPPSKSYQQQPSKSYQQQPSKSYQQQPSKSYQQQPSKSVSQPSKSNQGSYKSTGYGYNKKSSVPELPPIQQQSKKYKPKPLTQPVDYVHGLYNQEQQEQQQQGYEVQDVDAYDKDKTNYDSQVQQGYNSYNDQLPPLVEGGDIDPYQQQQPDFGYVPAENGAKSGYDAFGEDNFVNGYGKKNSGYNQGYGEEGAGYGTGNGGYNAEPSFSSNPCDGYCLDNPSGLFPHPQRDDWFIQCGNGMDRGQTCECCKPYYLRCPRGTTFDVSTRVCSKMTGDYGTVDEGVKSYKPVEY